mmetsp:Transcript_97768/g.226701  ORF Transcript_97768/g.226701 Transcript_97768/m.226701 type:complete len:587 (+) Transcript_97768:26-1786(+)
MMEAPRRHAGGCWCLALAMISFAYRQLSRLQPAPQAKPAFVTGCGATGTRPRAAHALRRQRLGDCFPGFGSFDPTPRGPMEEVGFIDAGLESLDAKQREAVDAVLDGGNVFITGGAGTGKSRTLNTIVAQLQLKLGEAFKDKVAVTATTGTAAINVGGCTLHHITGVRVPKEVKDFKRIAQGPYKIIWQQMEVVVVDEASMLSGEFFDLLDEQIMRLRDGRPLQFVLVGDLYQLPPVAGTITCEAFEELEPDLLNENRAVRKLGPRATYEYFLNRGMIFQSRAYFKKEFRVIELTTQHRQHGDTTLAKCLRNLRGGVDENAVHTLNQHCYRPLEVRIQHTVTLVPTNADADNINSERLRDIRGKAKQYVATDSVLVGAPPQNLTRKEATEWTVMAKEMLQRSDFFQEETVPKVMTLKIGALVMLSSTVDQRLDLVNGLTGRVTDLGRQGVTVFFKGRGRFIIRALKFHYPLPGLGECVREQFPLRLAWAITHHRSQGKTLNNVAVDPRSFAYGQVYVALSRARSLQTLRLLQPLEKYDIRTNPAVPAFEELQRNLTTLQKKGTVPEGVVTWQQLPVMKKIGKMNKR